MPSNSAGDAVGERAHAHALVTVPPPLELPRREAPDVDVVLVAAGVVTITSELDLELHLVLLDGHAQTEQVAPTPGPPHVRSGRRLGSLPSRITARALSRRIFSSGIWVTSTRAPAGPCSQAGGSKPDAVGVAPVAPNQQGPRGGTNNVAHELLISADRVLTF